MTKRKAPLGLRFVEPSEVFCRHFSGLANDRCKADVAYNDFRGGPAMPCFGPDENHAPNTCPKRAWSTQEDRDKAAREAEEFFQRREAILASGKCPECGKDIEPSTIEGRCRYAACGHRIGQVG